MSNSAVTLVWRRVGGGEGHSLGRVERVEDGWRADGHEILATDETCLSCTFTVRLNPDWLTLAATVVSLDGSGERRLKLRADERRRWWNDGRRAPDLDGCIDIDIAATPLTNTFPIRRLARELAGGEPQTSPVAWVEVPSLRLARVDQTYMRLDGDAQPGLQRWEYRDPTHGAFELVTDQDGFVVDYERFATRVRRVSG